MQINDFLHVSIILKILYLSSTKRSYLLTLCKTFIQIWLERIKINFMRILKGTKSYFNLQIVLSIITPFLSYFWLPVKFKVFPIISNRFQVFHTFILLFKDKLKVQHESATCLLCTNMLYSYITLFLGRS